MKAEQFILNHTRNCSNIEYRQGVYAPNYQLWITPEQALKAVAIEREEVIEKVCQYIREHRFKVYTYTEDNEITGWVPDVFIENLKKYMEEQV